MGIFVELKKTFDTVDHDIQLKELKHYDVQLMCRMTFLGSYL